MSSPRPTVQVGTGRVNEEKAARGTDTGWHRVAQGGTRVAHLGIRTILKGESPESVPVCGGDTLTHRFDKLFILHMHVCYMTLTQ